MEPEMTRIRRPRWQIVHRACTIVVLVASAGCEADSATSARVEVRSVSLAKGGGSGGTSGTLAVTSTAPASTRQDTIVDVHVYGSGFTSGAAATWSLAGDTTKVHVQSTKFVSSGQLVARIVVPTNAPVASYDVAVALIGGKKGVGAELFAVTPGDPTATFLFPLDDASLNVKSDRIASDGTYSAYTNGYCGVEAKIFATTEFSNSGDATLSMGNARKGTGCVAPRHITVVFPDGLTATMASFDNLRQVENTTYAIPVGSTVKRAFHLGMSSTRCDGLAWSNLAGGVGVPGDSVLVTRTAADTWHVQSQPAPNNRAWCKPNGPTYNMAVDFTLRSARPLP
jgi:hypothetical protein